MTLKPEAAAFRCRAAEAVLWRLTRISVESLLMPEQSQSSQNQPGLDDLITLVQAAEISGLSASHLRLLVRSGEIWGKKMGRDWFTNLRAVQEYLDIEHKPGRKSQK